MFSAMKYPKSKKSAKRYAEYLSKLHGRVFVPIERTAKIKNEFALNFAAAEEGEELTDYLSEGWKVIE
jgi:hypothetical protein